MSSDPPNPRAGHEQLRDVLERVSDAVVALDKEWRYTYVNRRAAELFGRRPGDLLGRHIWTEFPEGVGQPFHLAYEQAMAEQVFIQCEHYYEPWDRWFENRIYPSLDGLTIFFHEITDRKRAEQAAHDNATLLEGQNRVLESIGRGEPLEHTLDMLLHSIEEQCPEMVCSILLPEADGVHVRHGAAPSLPATFTDAIAGTASPCGTAFARAAIRPEVVIVDDIATDTLWDDCRGVALEHGLLASWSSPILDVNGCVLGTFAVYSRTPARPSGRHRYLIDVATQTAATALINHRETEARRVSEARLRMAVTGGNVGIWEWDIVTGSLRPQRPAQGHVRLADPHRRSHAEGCDERHPPGGPAADRAGSPESVTWGVDYDVEYRVVGSRGAPCAGSRPRGVVSTTKAARPFA